MPTVNELEKLVILRNEKLLKQFALKPPPQELMKGMAERFFTMAEAENENKSDEIKREILSEMYTFMQQFLDDPYLN